MRVEELKGPEDKAWGERYNDDFIIISRKCEVG